MVKLKKIAPSIYIGLVLVFIYLPIFYLIAFSFTKSKVIGVWQGFSFDLYAELFTGKHSKDILNALLNTLLVGFTSSIIATILGAVAAVGIHNSSRRIKKTMNNANQIPILNAEIVTAVGLLLFFATIGLANQKGFWTVMVSHVAFITPFVVLSVMPKLKQMNTNVYEAALDLGATPSMALFKVVLPEIFPGMVSGFLLAFTLSVDDFIITQFTTSANFQTLSTYIYATYSGKDAMLPEFRALSTILFLVVLTILIIINIRAIKNKKEY